MCSNKWEISASTRQHTTQNSIQTQPEATPSYRLTQSIRLQGNQTKNPATRTAERHTDTRDTSKQTTNVQRKACSHSPPAPFTRQQLLDQNGKNPNNEGRTHTCPPATTATDKSLPRTRTRWKSQPQVQQNGTTEKELESHGTFLQRPLRTVMHAKGRRKTRKMK